MMILLFCGSILCAFAIHGIFEGARRVYGETAAWFSPHAEHELRAGVLQCWWLSELCTWHFRSFSWEVRLFWGCVLGTAFTLGYRVLRCYFYRRRADWQAVPARWAASIHNGAMVGAVGGGLAGLTFGSSVKLPFAPDFTAIDHLFALTLLLFCVGGLVGALLICEMRAVLATARAAKQARWGYRIALLTLLGVGLKFLSNPAAWLRTGYFPIRQFVDVYVQGVQSALMSMFMLAGWKLSMSIVNGVPRFLGGQILAWLATLWFSVRRDATILCAQCYRHTSPWRARYADGQRYCEHCRQAVEQTREPGRLIATFGNVPPPSGPRVFVLADPDFERYADTLDVTDIQLDPATAERRLLEKLITHLVNYPPRGGVANIRVTHLGELSDLGEQTANALRNTFPRLAPFTPEI